VNPLSARRLASISFQSHNREHQTIVEMDPSLIKAMGGPSSGKAGVSRDPEETNRIIAEASKNSKYFQV
jgi:hypothetical protein